MELNKEPITETPDFQKEFDTLKATNQALLSRLEALEGKKPDEKDLNDKAKDLRSKEEKTQNDTKALEAALRFSLSSADWLKTNAALLPKDIADIFKAAEKENFETPIEKDAALKAGIIQSFFGVQSNLDLLTPGLKNELEEFLKLTKTGKQERAQEIYNSVFEPAFEMLRRVKKAEALSKGFGDPSDSESSYKKRLMEHSQKHYQMGVK